MNKFAISALVSARVFPSSRAMILFPPRMMSSSSLLADVSLVGWGFLFFLLPLQQHTTTTYNNIQQTTATTNNIKSATIQHPQQCSTTYITTKQQSTMLGQTILTFSVIHPTYSTKSFHCSPPTTFCLLRSSFHGKPAPPQGRA